MRASIAVVVIVSALIVAVGLALQGGRYQLVTAGPESAYLVQRWTGETWLLTGASSQPVRAAPEERERDFGK